MEQKKLCKHCKSEMPKKAKVCPTCHKSQSSMLLKFIVIIAIIFGCVVACTSACTKGVSDAVDEVNKDTENKKQALKVEENTVKGSLDKYGISYYIEGYLKNTSNEKFDYIQITYTAYDKDGNTLGTCLDNNSGLEANGRWKFKAACIDDVENIKSYKLTEITGW